jgi:PBP1b-binding outer membrane lipoprotein LpoB
MAKTNINVKSMIDNPLHVENINEITKEKLQNFVSTLPRDEINALKQHIAMNHPKNSNGTFMMARAYIYNKYVKPQPVMYGTNKLGKEQSFQEFLENL